MEFRDKQKSSHGQITVTVIQDTASFEALRNEWNSLLFETDNSTIFLTWEWLFAWWKTVGQHKNQLRIFLVRRQSKLIGIAPLMLNTKRKYAISFLRLQSLGHPECDVSGIITNEIEATTDSILSYLKENRQEWDILELNEFSLTDQNCQHFLLRIKESIFFEELEVEEHFYIPTNKDWDEYYGKLSKNLRRNYKRRLKRATEVGGVNHSTHIGNSLTWEIFQTIFSINENGNFPNLYKDDNAIEFHKHLFKLMNKKSWIQIEIFQIENKPVAYQYGFLLKNKYEDWRGGFDKNFDTLAPGKLLMMKSLEHHFKNDTIVESNLLRGKHSYKTDWNPASRQFGTIKVYNTKRTLINFAYALKRFVQIAKLKKAKPDIR